MNHMHTAYCSPRICDDLDIVARYIVVPPEHAATWDDLLSYARARYGVWGNDFIGSREFRASSGALVFKLYI